ncbi:protein-domain-containing protein [Entophlyctis helioformis]|nr:protein-domain-containing protein [Entophlyctis helioformis]
MPPFSRTSRKTSARASGSCICRSSTLYNEITGGLLHSILTRMPNFESSFNILGFLDRDKFLSILGKLKYLASTDKHQQLFPTTRMQITWLVGMLAQDGSHLLHISDIIAFLMRQIRGGDLSPDNVSQAKMLVELMYMHKDRLFSNRMLKYHALFFLVRHIADHERFVELRTMEEKLLEFLTSSQMEDCVIIGRDFIFSLMQISRLPFAAQLLKKLMASPSPQYPGMPGIADFLERPTPREFLIARLTPDMEIKLVFILQHIEKGFEYTFFERFRRRFVHADNETLYPDLIRYICGVVHPSNQILASSIVQRWDLITSLLRGIKSTACAQACKLALYFDWLFFNPTRDNIMCLEPGILLLYKCVKRHPYITATMIEFLAESADRVYPEHGQKVLWSLQEAMRTVTSKQVIASLSLLMQATNLDRNAKELLKKLFPMFIESSVNIQTVGFSGEVSTVEPSRDPRLAHAMPRTQSPTNGVSALSASDSILPSFSNDTGGDAFVSEEVVDDEPPAQEEETVSVMEFVSCMQVYSGDNDSEAQSAFSEECRAFLGQFVSDDCIDEPETVGALLRSKVDVDLAALWPIGDATLPACITLLEQVIAEYVSLRASANSNADRLTRLVEAMVKSNSQFAPALLVAELRESSWTVSDADGSFFVACLGRAQLMPALMVVLDHDSDWFFHILPAVLRCYGSWLTGRPDLLKCIVSNIDADQLLELGLAIRLGNMRLFGLHLAATLAESLSWTSFEQWAVWALLGDELVAESSQGNTVGVTSMFAAATSLPQAAVLEHKYTHSVTGVDGGVSERKTGQAFTEAKQGVMAIASRVPLSEAAVRAVLIGLQDMPSAMTAVMLQWLGLYGVDRLVEAVRNAVLQYAGQSLSKMDATAIAAAFEDSGGDDDEDHDSADGRQQAGGRGVPEGGMVSAAEAGKSPGRRFSQLVSPSAARLSRTIASSALNIAKLSSANLRVMLQSLATLQQTAADREHSAGLHSVFASPGLKEALEQVPIPDGWQRPLYFLA